LGVTTGQSNAVFISYRREVSRYFATALYQSLTQRGVDAFYDIRSIGAGHFDTVILTQMPLHELLGAPVGVR
jgi:hypothetical protein